MFVADSSIAVGLAIFLPTAWAKGCRAPYGKSKPESGRRRAHAQVKVCQRYYDTGGRQAKVTGKKSMYGVGKEATMVMYKGGSGIGEEYSNLPG